SAQNEGSNPSVLRTIPIISARAVSSSTTRMRAVIVPSSFGTRHGRVSDAFGTRVVECETIIACARLRDAQPRGETPVNESHQWQPPVGPTGPGESAGAPAVPPADGTVTPPSGPAASGD